MSMRTQNNVGYLRQTEGPSPLNRVRLNICCGSWSADQNDFRLSFVCHSLGSASAQRINMTFVVQSSMAFMEIKAILNSIILYCNNYAPVLLDDLICVVFVWQAFANHYCDCNPDIVSSLHSTDSVFLLAFAIIMLNTDLHNSSIKPERKMKLQDFIRNLRGSQAWPVWLNIQFLSSCICEKFIMTVYFIVGYIFYCSRANTLRICENLA